MMERDGAGGAVRGVTRGRLRLRGMVSYSIFKHGYINITFRAVAER